MAVFDGTNVVFVELSHGTDTIGTKFKAGENSKVINWIRKPILPAESVALHVLLIEHPVI